LTGSTIAIYGDANANYLNVQAVGGGTTDLSTLKFDATSTGQSGTALWDTTDADLITVTGSALNEVIVGSTTNDKIIGGAGNDTIDLSAGGDDIVKFESTATANGVDTISSFELAGVDKLDFTAFLGGTASVLTTAGVKGTSGLDLAGGTKTVGVWANAATLATTDIATTTATNKVTVADNGKAVVLVNADADGTGITTDWNVYYVEDTDTGATQSFAVTLVGTLTVNAGLDTSAEVATAALYV